MKTFEDLEFKPWSNRNTGSVLLDRATHATLNFENGYGVSVLFGTAFHSNGIDTYEVGILLNGALTYDTEITDDVLPHLTKEDVTEVMQKVQAL